MNYGSAPPEIGFPAVPAKGRKWVQTERKAHEAWSRLCVKSPSAAAIMHVLVAQMGNQNAVVISQKVLAKLIGTTDRTVRSAIKTLTDENWIQAVKMNGPGTVSAYVVNDRVAWGQPRDELNLSIFSATVVADAGDQDANTLSTAALRKIPMLFPGEMQLPSGPGEDPPSEPAIPGMERDLPAIVKDDKGVEYEVNAESGEIQGFQLK